MSDEWIRLSEAAKRFNVSAPTLRRAAAGWTDPRSGQYHAPTLPAEERTEYNGLKVWWVRAADVERWRAEGYTEKRKRSAPRTPKAAEPISLEQAVSLVAEAKAGKREAAVRAHEILSSLYQQAYQERNRAAQTELRGMLTDLMTLMESD